MMPALVVHGFTRFGAIDATIDGQRVSIPDDAGNRDRALIAAWEAEGNTIPAYEPPAPTAEEMRAETFRSDPARVDLLARLKSATPAQIEGYIDANVTTLAQARTFLKALAKVIALDGRG